MIERRTRRRFARFLIRSDPMDYLFVATGFTGAFTLLFLARALARMLFPTATHTVHFSPKGGCTDVVVAEIARARQQGYAAVDQELELGLRTISVPLKSYRGEVLAAMNISVHLSSETGSVTVDGIGKASLSSSVRSWSACWWL